MCCCLSHLTRCFTAVRGTRHQSTAHQASATSYSFTNHNTAAGSITSPTSGVGGGSVGSGTATLPHNQALRINTSNESQSNNAGGVTYATISGSSSPGSVVLLEFACVRFTG